MNLRSTGVNSLGAAAMLALFVTSVNAQVRRATPSSSATHVSAEMTYGKLNPTVSKPGDKVALKLKDDVKSNGEVVLKKGTTIDGVVRNVKTVKGEGHAQSMMKIEWLEPAAQGKVKRQFSIALQSVNQVDRPEAGQAESSGDDFGLIGAGPAAGSGSGRSSGLGGGLLASPVGATTGVVGSARGLSNAAMLSMPSVVAVDHQTAASLESSLGTSSSGGLFRVGHGELITASGSKQSVDLFSHLSNDTVITSSGVNFEISRGAQMELLVGVRK
jgi:hypothetical protein